MARLGPDILRRARDLIALYPQPRSALIPLLHLVQEQDGYLTRDGMEHVAELLDLNPVEVLATASFYDMFFTHPVGRHLVSVCTNVACLLAGGVELLEHAEKSLGVKAGGTTVDGEFTLEEVECIALCGDAPCLAVNWRFRGNVTNEAFDQLVDDLRAGRLADEIPLHGTLNRVPRSVGLAAASAPDGPARGADRQGAAAPAAQTVTEQGTREPAPRPSESPAHAGAAEQLEHPDGADSAPQPDGSRPQKAGD